MDDLQLAYRSAAAKYEEAARLVASFDTKQQWDFLLAARVAPLRPRRLTPTYQSLTRAVQIALVDKGLRFLRNRGQSRSPMPELPECLAALKLLDDDLLGEFPFVDEASRSVALSALLTGVSRPALMLAPMHAYSAPEAGTGKSYLADLVVLLATGRFAAAINAGKDEEELEKGSSRLSRRRLLDLAL